MEPPPKSLKPIVPDYAPEYIFDATMNIWATLNTLRTNMDIIVVLSIVFAPYVKDLSKDQYETVIKLFTKALASSVNKYYEENLKDD